MAALIFPELSGKIVSYLKTKGVLSVVSCPWSLANKAWRVGKSAQAAFPNGQ